MSKELDERQKLFCEKFLEGFTGTRRVSPMEAYQFAYPDCNKKSASASGSRLLTYVNVKEYLKERISEMTMQTNEVLIRLGNLARNAEKDSDKLKALELIGKTQGMFLDRTDITSGGVSLVDYINSIAKLKKDQDLVETDIISLGIK